VRRLFTSTDRVARTVAILLGLIALAAVITAWTIQRQQADRRASLSEEVPPSLTSGTASVVTSAPPPHVRTPHGHGSNKAGSKKAVKHREQTQSMVVKPIVPNHLFVPAISVNTKVIPKPTEMDNDPFLNKVVPSFGVPDDMYTTTWWSSGPQPGSRGMAVVLGHTQIGGYGVFNNLAKLKRGDPIGLSHGHTTLKFAVIAVHTGISKKDPTALQTLLANHPKQARVALLTCSGYFNQSYRESAENTVVFAKLVSVSH
jgi:LPXTG-site transpeptidase (sortase) family protein